MTVNMPLMRITIDGEKVFINCIASVYQCYSSLGICVQRAPLNITPDSKLPQSCTILISVMNGLEYPHAIAPSISLGIDNNLVRERICLAGSDRGDVILLSVDGGHNLHCGFQQHSFHGTSDLGPFYNPSNQYELSFKIMRGNTPVSVRGVARVTSKVHCSQQTSSSAFVNQAFLRFFSKNWTAINPLTPVLRPPMSELVSNCLTRVAVR